MIYELTIKKFFSYYYLMKPSKSWAVEMSLTINMEEDKVMSDDTFTNSYINLFYTN